MKQGIVLCIGNDPLNLNLRCSLLRECGWNVVVAGGGHEGVFRFSERHVDVVAIDLNADGSEAALITAELKRLRPNVPVILLVTDPKTLTEGATQQADAVVLKAEEAQLLHHTLRSVLRPS